MIVVIAKVYKIAAILALLGMIIGIVLTIPHH